MAQAEYGQFCAMARALEVIGERWTLLIVRELLIGPQRYTDLLAGLGSVSPNVLAERLKKLEELGVVARRRLPPPAASTVYELTALGTGLRPAVAELIRWGLNFLTERRPGETARLDHLLMALRLTADPGASIGHHESCEFHVDEHTFHLTADDGSVALAAGPARDPAAVITTDFETLAAIGAGRMSPEQALAAHRLALRGDPAAAVRAGKILNRPRPAPDDTGTGSRHPAVALRG
jgi:DNA-binding HxlR family transcriptional regulator